MPEETQQLVTFKLGDTIEMERIGIPGLKYHVYVQQHRVNEQVRGPYTSLTTKIRKEDGVFRFKDYKVVKVVEAFIKQAV